MNQQFMKQAEEMFQAAQQARMPDGMKAIAEDGLAKSHEAYKNLAAAAKDASAAMETLTSTAQKSAKTIGDKAFAHMTKNAEAAFEAAHAIASSRTLPEAAKIQAEFVQKQFAKAGEQTKELYELSSKLTRETVEQMSKSAAKTMEKAKSRG